MLILQELKLWRLNLFSKKKKMSLPDSSPIGFTTLEQTQSSQDNASWFLEEVCSFLSLKHRKIWDSTRAVSVWCIFILVHSGRIWSRSSVVKVTPITDAHFTTICSEGFMLSNSARAIPKQEKPSHMVRKIMKTRSRN